MTVIDNQDEPEAVEDSSDELNSLTFTEEQSARIWERYSSEEEIFNNRLNFFLILETLLLGGVIAFVGQSTPDRYTLIVLSPIIIVGNFLTLVWVYIQARQKYVLDAVRRWAYQHLPEFRAMEDDIYSKYWPLKIRNLLAYIIPLVFLVTWFVLFLFLTAWFVLYLL